MRRSILAAWTLAALTACFLLLGPATVALPAQEATGDADESANEIEDATGAIGLLDVQAIFEQYSRFKELLSELKAEIDRAEEELKEKQPAFRDMQEQLKLLVVGTREHTELEASITKSKVELEARVRTQKTGFLRRESRIYYDVYEEIVQEVERYAMQHKIAVVIRVHDRPVNMAEPKEVLNHINKAVVWHDKRRDITRAILQRLEQRSASSQQDAEEPPADPPKP